MKAAVLLAFICAVPLVGAAKNSRVRHHATSYEPAEIAWSRQTGTAGLQGAASWQYRGKTWRCTGVLLVAQSAYADESVQGTFGNTEEASVTLDKAAGYRDFDPGYLRDARNATCDEEGRFQFAGLPAGTYYVMPRIVVDSHVTVVGGANYKDTHGMLHMRRVVLSDGQQAVLQFN